MAYIEVKDLSFRYNKAKKYALENINLNINRGEFVLVCGKSGSGKSTLLSHFKPVLSPFGEKSGEIFFDGVSLENMSKKDAAKKIAFVTQYSDDQIVTDKVWHEIAFGLESVGEAPEKIRLRTCEIAGALGLDNIFNKNTTELSGGQKQLLNIASVLALDPKVLVLDEPTSQLDPIAANEFMDTIRHINEDFAITVIISEHHLEQAFLLADRIAVLENGKVLSFDSKKATIDFLYKNNNEIKNALPSCVKIAAELGFEEEYPLSISQCRNLLISRYGENDVEHRKISKMKSEKPVLELKNISFRYEKNGADILKEINFSVESGKITSIVGPNGSGKTTLLSVMSGRLIPIDGKFLYNGKKIKNTGELVKNGKLAMLCQNPRLMFSFDNSMQELTDICKDKNIIEKICCQLNITDILNQHPFDLSGGEQQRLALAKILLKSPQIILLDEPTKGMDFFLKEELITILKALTKSGCAVVIVSHDIEFTSVISDNCVMLFNGEIVSEGKPAEFYSQNNYYTTAAYKISRGIFERTVTTQEVVMRAKSQSNYST